MKAGSSVINTTSLAAYGGSAELLDYSSTEGSHCIFYAYLFVCLFLRLFTDFGSCLHCRWCYCQCLILLAALLACHGSMVYCRNDWWIALGKLLGMRLEIRFSLLFTNLTNLHKTIINTNLEVGLLWSFLYFQMIFLLSSCHLSSIFKWELLVA